VKISAKAATQAVQATVNGSALLASLGVVPAATPQAPPQVIAIPTAATAVPAMASPAAAVPAAADPAVAAAPAAAATPEATEPGKPALEFDDDAQLKD
jgi:hypothetical protein